MAGWRAMITGGALLAATVAAGDDATPPQATPTAAPRLHLPQLHAEAIGPTQVRLTAETAPEDTRYVYDVWAECTDAEGHTHRLFFNGRAYEGTEWTATDGVAAGSTVRYRAYTESGITGLRSNSDWSNEVSVQTLPAPEKPPPAPTDLSARPAGPFRVELAWRDRSDSEYGFEVRKRVGDDWVRVVLVDPDQTRVTLHGRPPATSAQYRVRAFNLRGVSADSNEATVRSDALVDRPPLLREPQPRPTPAPCTTREQAMRDLQSDGLGETGGAVPDEPLYESKLGGAWELVEFAYPPLCGNANCSWVIYGNDHGCFRRLGEAFGVGQELVGSTPSGLPVLIDIGHSSASDSGATLMQLVDGWFSPVDSYGHCAHSADDLTTLTPPFSGCQEDDDLWWKVGD